MKRQLKLQLGSFDLILCIGCVSTPPPPSKHPTPGPSQGIEIRFQSISLWRFIVIYHIKLTRPGLEPLSVADASCLLSVLLVMAWTQTRAQTRTAHTRIHMHCTHAQHTHRQAQNRLTHRYTDTCTHILIRTKIHDTYLQTRLQIHQHLHIQLGDLNYCNMYSSYRLALRYGAVMLFIIYAGNKAYIALLQSRLCSYYALSVIRRQDTHLPVARTRSVAKLTVAARLFTVCKACIFVGKLQHLC